MFGIFFALLCTLALVALWRRPRYYGAWARGGGCGCGGGRADCGPGRSGQGGPTVGPGVSGGGPASA